jgi:hypothetical protein
MRMYHFFVEETGNPDFLVVAHNAGYALAYLVRYMHQHKYSDSWIESWEKATPENLPFKYRIQMKIEGEVVKLENC